jgi:hypothetical protein
MKDPKIFLKRYIWTNMELIVSSRKSGLRERVTRISVVSDNSRVQVSAHDHVGDMIAKIVDMEAALDKTSTSSAISRRRLRQPSAPWTTSACSCY